LRKNVDKTSHHRRHRPEFGRSSVKMSFDRPVGAAADAKELEYIAALVQTDDVDKDGFVDASIDARDIKYHLKSRYGIEISEEQVRKIILNGLGGGEDEDDCLDLCEVMAALIIPLLRKITKEHEEADKLEQGSSLLSHFKSKRYSGSRKTMMKTFKEQQLEDNEENLEAVFCDQVSKEEILSSVLHNILAQATGSVDPQPLTKELVHKIFAAYDETVLVQRDNLVSEMIAAAKGNSDNDEYAEDGGTVLFDIESFARALTADIMLYDPEVENSATTGFADVFGAKYWLDQDGINDIHESLKVKKEKETFVDGLAEDARVLIKNNASLIKHDTLDGIGKSTIADGEHGPITKVFAFSALDFTVDNYKSRIHSLCLFMGFVFFYLRFLLRFDQYHVCPNDDNDGFWCKLGQSTVNWIFIMLTLTLSGILFFVIVGSGNDVYRRSFLDISIGLAGIVLFFVIPNTVKFRIFLFDTDVNDRTVLWVRQDEPQVTVFFHVLFIIVGVVLFIRQVLNVISLLLDHKKTAQGKGLWTRLLVGSTATDELHSKRAAVYKVNKMLENAYNLHQRKGLSLSTAVELAEESTHDLALLNFTKLSDKTERVGGFKWAWKSLISGDLKAKEGIWLHTRLYAGLLSQLVVVVIVLFIGSNISASLFDLTKENHQKCAATFDPSNCVALPNIQGTNPGVIACTDVDLIGSGCNDELVGSEIIQKICKILPMNPITNQTFCSDTHFSIDGTQAADSTDDVRTFINDFCNFIPPNPKTNQSYCNDTLTIDVTQALNTSVVTFVDELCNNFTLDQLNITLDLDRIDAFILDQLNTQFSSITARFFSKQISDFSSFIISDLNDKINEIEDQANNRKQTICNVPLSSANAGGIPVLYSNLYTILDQLCASLPLNPDTNQAFCNEPLYKGVTQPVDVNVYTFIDDFCNFLPVNPITNQSFCDDSLLLDFKLPMNSNLFTYNQVYGNVLGENIEDNNDCRAELTACFQIGDDVSFNETNVCLFGLSTSFPFLPYSFNGADCENISPINEILEARPSFIEFANDQAETLRNDIVPRPWM